MLYEIKYRKPGSREICVIVKAKTATQAERRLRDKYGVTIDITSIREITNAKFS